MRSVALMFTFVATVLGGVASLVAVAQEPAKIVLKDKDYEKEIRLKRGDIFDVKLPAQMPVSWAQSEANGMLRELKGYPKYVDAPRGNEETLGAPGFSIHRFEVVGESDTPIELKLIYCKFGKPAVTAKRIDQNQIPKPPAFRPDQKPEDLREGMVYHVMLKTKG